MNGGVSVEVGRVATEEGKNKRVTGKGKKKSYGIYAEVVKGHRSQATGHSASRGHLERRDTEMGEIK